MKHLRHRLRGAYWLVFGLVVLTFVGSTACSRKSSTMGLGTDPGSITGTDPYSTGTDPTTPVTAASVTTATNAATGCSAGQTAGSGTSGCFASQDTSAVGSVINGITPINPAQSSLPDDLNQEIIGLVQQAADGGNVDEVCSSGDNNCFNRSALAGQILQSTANKVKAYAPRPGYPMVGTYAGKCPPLSGYTDGNIVARVTASSGDRFNTDFNFPKVMKVNGVAVTGESTLKFKKSAGDGVTQVTFTDQPSAATGALKISNSSAHYSCNATLTMTRSDNPIPVIASQGIKIYADGLRKAFLISSPMFNLMMNSMPKDQAANLLLSFMQLENN